MIWRARRWTFSSELDCSFVRLVCYNIIIPLEHDLCSHNQLTFNFSGPTGGRSFSLANAGPHQHFVILTLGLAVSAVVVGLGFACILKTKT